MNDSFYKNFNKIESISLALFTYLQVFIDEIVLVPLKKSAEFMKKSMKTADCDSVSEILTSFTESVHDIQIEIYLFDLQKLVDLKNKRKI
ncbi:MAG: hypothetical protein JXR68_02785 [Bacteroidales bacterium]|nr:hypothetical protein [Bacteroidales bacterium]